VVPPLAESQYIIRAPLLQQVNEIYQRVMDVARGAALMTGTEVEFLFKKGMSNLLLNDTITDVLYDKMVQVGPPEYDQQEIEFARQISTTCPQSDMTGILIKMYGKEAREVVTQDSVLLSPVMPNVQMDFVAPGSTDVGDVSWVTPTGQIETTCAALNTPSHSWQIVAQSGMSIGHKGMLYAGKVMALAAQEFMNHPERLKAARDEFERKIKATPYECPISDGVQPF
jgi:aminobenzoyl-glutamate utilization protein B